MSAKKVIAVCGSPDGAKGACAKRLVEYTVRAGQVEIVAVAPVRLPLQRDNQSRAKNFSTGMWANSNLGEAEWVSVRCPKHGVKRIVRRDVIAAKGQRLAV